MTVEEFTDVLAHRIDHINKILGHKAAEYSRNGDRLHNFKRGGNRLGEIPERYLMELNEKHICSLMDMVDDLDRGELGNYSTWDEKIGDAINYLILLDALVTERLHRTLDSQLQNMPPDHPSSRNGIEQLVAHQRNFMNAWMSRSKD